MLVDGFRSIVAAMDTHDVRRLIALGTISVPHPDDSPDVKARMLVASVKAPVERVNARNIGGKGGIFVSRTSVAAFMLDQVASRDNVHRAPFISNH